MSTIPPLDDGTYPQLTGPVFEAVHDERLYDDPKEFADSVPVSDPETVVDEFVARRDNPEFDLREFVDEYFEPPREVQVDWDPPAGTTMTEYVRGLWQHLAQSSDDSVSSDSTLIPLPEPYVKPGGRFREIYYWDSYFTAEGLVRSGMTDMVKHLVENFSYLIDRYGHIPNGNRVYYLSRSQPPLYYQLLRVLDRETDLDVTGTYRPYLESEYEFWMDGSASVSASDPSYRRVVQVDGTVLNRYWDDCPRPRREQYWKDVELADRVSGTAREKVFRDVRAGCESGWDFSSRWFEDYSNMETIRTTEIIPVDLNAILYDIETTLADWYEVEGKSENARSYRKQARQRRAAIQRHCWDREREYYFDYCWTDGERTDVVSAAGTWPLFVGLATDRQAAAVAETIRDRLLHEGGMAVTDRESGQQWDRPEGWAPMTWIAVNGLLNYGHRDLARTIATRWVGLNGEVYGETGHMMEKYDVVSSTAGPDLGHYDLQSGFGWTNGVLLGLVDEFDCL